MKIFGITGLIFALFSTSNAQVFTGSHKYEAKQWMQGLNRPWAITRGPDGEFFVTEKGGRLLIIKEGKIKTTLKDLPKDLAVVGQGGLMDIALHPEFKKNQWIYLSYTTRKSAQPTNGVNTRVSRFRLKGDQLTEEKILIQGGYGTDGAHFGCRLVFSKDNHLFATFGERHNKEKAQSLKYLNGKVIRIKDDGSIPTDNPFVGQNGARGEIYTLGHRNPQGIDLHPLNEIPVISEHGPTGYDAHIPGVGSIGKADEVNWLISGRNYGWPIVFGDPKILPWTQAMHQFAKENQVVMPTREFTNPDGIAPSGASFYRGEKFPKWKNDFFVASLRGYVIRLKISKTGQLLEEEKIIPNGFSRVRDVENGTDGFLYILSDRGTITQLRSTSAE